MENDGYSLDKLTPAERPPTKSSHPVTVPIGVVARGAPQYAAFISHMPKHSRELFAQVTWPLMRGGAKFQDIIVLRGAVGGEFDRLKRMCSVRYVEGRVVYPYAVSAGVFDTYVEWAALIDDIDRKRFLYVSAFKPLRRHLQWQRLITLRYAETAPYKLLEDAIQPQLVAPEALPILSTVARAIKKF